MSRRWAVCLGLLVCMCLYLLALNLRYQGYLDRCLAAHLAGERHPDNQTLIAGLLENQRRILETEMTGYPHPELRKFEDLLMEKGGRPMRSVILSSWRSGSTFLGEIVNAHPASFYVYEPLVQYGNTQIQKPPLSSKATDIINSIFECDYSTLGTYLNFLKNHTWIIRHNYHLWKQCVQHPELCSDHRFLSKFCKLFPFQIMKIVRLRLKFMEIFLNQTNLGVKVVLLIRDPRGTLQSRWNQKWCLTREICYYPNHLCSDLVEDYRAAVRFSKLYPDSFRVMRYEELSLDPYDLTAQLLDFYGLNMHQNVLDYLSTHTRFDLGGPSSTFRDSRSKPFVWRAQLKYSDVEYIQQECALAMRLWGYVPAVNASHQLNLQPLASYELDNGEDD